MPWVRAPGHLAPRGVEGHRGGVEIGDRPRPLGLEQQHQVSKVVRRVHGACGQPTRYVVEFGEETTSLLAVLGITGLAGHRQPAQEAGPRRLVMTGDGGKERDCSAGVALEIARISEYRRGDRAVDMGVEERHWIVGILVVWRHLISLMAAFAAQGIGQPSLALAVEPLGGLLATRTTREG
jgi:hypothetical protein